MDPLDPTRRRDPATDVYADCDRAPSSPAAVRRPDDGTLGPDLPDVDAGLLARAVRAATTRAPAPDVAHTDKPARDVEVQRRLDDLRDAATPVYRTDAGDVSVATPFRTAKDPALLKDDGVPAGIYARREATVDANRGALLKIAASAGIAPGDVLLVQIGRGSPELVRRLTQALLDQGRLPARVVSSGAPPRESRDLPTRVQAMMTDYGIGLDGAGYARQALPASRGFARVGVADARPGDIVAFRSSERAIVYDRRDATPDESAALRKAPGFGSGHVTTWIVDAAWKPRWSDVSVDFVGGGVRRETMWHDEESGRWARKDAGGVVRVSTGPGSGGDELEDELEGVYRRSDRAGP